MAIQRGEIYFVNLNPVKGREQAGHRPVLVLSIDTINQLPLVITVVVGTKGDNISRDYLTNVLISYFFTSRILGVNLGKYIRQIYTRENYGKNSQFAYREAS